VVGAVMRGIEREHAAEPGGGCRTLAEPIRIYETGAHQRLGVHGVRCGGRIVCCCCRRPVAVALEKTSLCQPRPGVHGVEPGRLAVLPERLVETSETLEGLGTAHARQRETGIAAYGVVSPGERRRRIPLAGRDRAQVELDVCVARAQAVRLEEELPCLRRIAARECRMSGVHPGT